MKKELNVRKLMLLLLLIGSPVKANDKVVHMAVSAGLTYTLSKIVHAALGSEKGTKNGAVVMGSLSTLTMGFAMEVGDSIDRNSRRIDAGDMGANALGVAVGSMFALEF
jgi:hypothetical protein